MDEIELLDAAKEKTGSDYATAKALGIAPQRINNIRRGAARISPWMAGRMGEIVGMNGAAVAFDVMASHAPNIQEKKDWKRWSGVATVCVMLSAICATALPSTAYAATGVAVCILCKVAHCVQLASDEKSFA